MARTTTRRPQAAKRDRHCIIFDANVRENWRKMYCRDRNAHMRGHDGYDKYDAEEECRNDARLEKLYRKEQLAETNAVERNEPMAYHPNYGWLYTDNQLDKVAFGFDPHRPLGWTVESKRFSACKPVGKPVKVKVATERTHLYPANIRNVQLPSQASEVRPKRILNRDEYRELALSGPIRRRRR